MSKQAASPVLTADYIIVGAGSAGAVLANRLSADLSNNVLLIEAGSAGMGLKTSIPAGSFLLIGNPKADWRYIGEPDPTINDRQICWSAGRMLGGSSAINGMVYFRGARTDYDGWAAQGCRGWSFNEVFPFFLRSEQFHGSVSQTHGSSGPLSVSPARILHGMTEVFRKGCFETGIPLIDEYCAGDINGSFLAYATTDKGQRSSTAKAFLEPIKSRSNLTILTDCEIEKVLFEGTRATAVRVRRPGTVQDYAARKEIIISSGALGSPAIILRSGIGPAAELKALGQEVVADVPGVGKNFHDHISVSISKEVSLKTYNVGVGPISMAGNLLKYFLFKRGPLSSTPVHAMAYGKTNPDIPVPDIAMSFIPIAIDLSGQSPKLHKRSGVTIGLHAARPRGRGQVRLNPQDLTAKPIIEHHMLGDEYDVNMLVDGCELLERIFEAPTLAPYVLGGLDPPTRPQSREEWIAFIRRRAATGYHPVGTCKMGTDDMAVVSPELKVAGVQGLRVADASIMPSITSGNTNAPIIMIAEKAAEIILQSRA